MSKRETWYGMLVLLAIAQAVPSLFAQDFTPLFLESESIKSTDTKDSTVDSHEQTLPRIQFLPHAKINTMRISLGDVALCEGPRNFCTTAKHVDFGKAPLPAEKKILTSVEIKSVLATEFPQQVIEIVAPDKMEITTAYQEVDKFMVESVLQDLLEIKLKNKPNIRVKFARVLFAKKIRFLPGDYRLDIPLLSELNWDDTGAIADQIAGRKVIDIVGVQESNQRTESTKASVHIELEHQIPVARNAKLQGEIVQHQDLELRWLSFSKLNHDALTNVTSIADKKVKTGIRAGSPFSAKNIEAPSLVKRGVTVKVILSKNGLNITSEAKAMSNGGMGDTVKIYASATKKNIQAKVIGENLVEASL